MLSCISLSAALALPAAAPAATVGSAALVVAPPAVDARSIADFYEAQGRRLLWFAPGNEQAASELLALLDSAKLDGLEPQRYRTRDLDRTLRAAWGGNPAARQRADFLLSQSFAAYVRDLRSAPDVGVAYVDQQLRPQSPSPRSLLEDASAAPSLERYVAEMRWMHPYYAPLRAALAKQPETRQRALLTVNLERARALPAASSGRYVLVNAAAQRLYMYDNGQVQDSMRVVVGKPAQQTPMMAALIRFTSLNPYWNVPPDLTAERIAPFVLKDGLSFLRARGYQVLSDWSDDATVVDPATIDWKAVADGSTEIRVRQLPGAGNSMGDMKFMFPNAQGVYLHDTPSTELFSEASRLFSGGCVRLEAAPRLAQWLYGKPLKASSKTPELRVDLPQPVPVYLTYLTAAPGEAGEITYYDDSYGRDAARLAQLTSSIGSADQLAGR